MDLTDYNYKPKRTAREVLEDFIEEHFNIIFAGVILAVLFGAFAWLSQQGRECAASCPVNSDVCRNACLR